MLKKTRAIRPDDFELFAQIPEIACIARDDQSRVIWHTPLFYRWPGVMLSDDQIMGTTVEEVIPGAAAQERIKINNRVMETGIFESHYQLSADRRILCSIFPLDTEAFGHKGVFVVLKESPYKIESINLSEIPVISTPNLDRLSALSGRELEVLHFVASGMTTHEIAERICRADKTIEHHVNSIHGKLGTHSRAQLVRFASERGIQSFSDEEWASIVQGARLVRKSGSRAKSEIEIKATAKTEVESG